jgi:GNAT superfamily N-acetyltransferase
LHAESWRTTYRSILPDAYLGQEIFKERKRFWRGRFLAPGMDRRYVLLAELAKGLVGFVCVLLDEEPEWGACLDNLHARSKFEGQGLGRQLFTKATEWVMEKESVWPIHLWVFKSNHAGRRFYDALNGHIVERKDKQMPGGANVPSRRYLWRNIQQLLSDLTAPILPRS